MLKDKTDRKPRKDKGVKRKPSGGVAYGFRLDTVRNKREIQIVEKMRQRVNSDTGNYFELREIMTMAINRLDDYEPQERVTVEDLQDALSERITELDKLIQRLQSLELQPASVSKKPAKKGNIDAGYLANLRNALIRSDD
jgi:hypothetical protein